MLKGLYRTLRRDERGITGLETAIILIAFVVVASVFAYTVLSAGIFSSQKGQEAVYAGLEEARASMTIKGSMFAYGNTTSDEVTSVSFCLVNTMKGQAIDLTPSGGNGTTNNVTIIGFTDSSQHVADLAWSTQFVGTDNGDNLLENEEQAIVTIDFTDTDAPVTGLGIYDSFYIEVKPVTGAALVMERTIPGRIDPVMDLN
ncbi:MAG: flagellin [Dehalococcoidia bacterium]|nr:MAG: flagellin [Dehalococcoidia bacterium]